MAAFLLLALVGSYALWQNRDAILESIEEATAQPEHGKEQYIESHFGTIIASIETAAAESSTRDELQARLARDSTLTEQVLYVSCKVAGSDEIVLVKRLDWQGRRTSTSGNYGSGTLTDSGESVPICIYRHEKDWSYIDALIVYFKYTEPEA